MTAGCAQDYTLYPQLCSTGRKASTTQDPPVFALVLLSSDKGRYFPDSGCSALRNEVAGCSALLDLHHGYNHATTNLFPTMAFFAKAIP